MTLLVYKLVTTEVLIKKENTIFRVDIYLLLIHIISHLVVMARVKRGFPQSEKQVNNTV